MSDLHLAPQSIPDQADRDAAIDPRYSVLLRAPAGSGKTGVLLLRYLNCLLTVEEPEAVVAITFTRKAAAEIRERILQALTVTGAGEEGYAAQLAALAQAVRERDRQRGWQLLENPSRLRISTFDSFCARIARRLPLLSGLGQVNTTDDAEALYRDAVFNLFRRLESGEPAIKSALGNVLDYANNRLEQLLPLLANLLAKRDQWVEGIVGGDLDAMENALAQVILAEYEDCAAALARHNFQTLIEIVRDQSAHEESLAWAADCADLLPCDPEQLPLHARLAALMLTGRERSLRKKVDKNLGFPPKQAATQALKEWLADARERADLDELTSLLCRLSDLPPPWIPEASRALIGDFVCVLKQLLAELHLIFDGSGQLDFPEVAFRAIRALQPLSESEGVYGDALLQEDRIAHLLVDEMQDTSVNQIVLLQYLMQGWEPGDGRSLFLCGDLQQSIYLFRGALVGEFESLLQLGHFNGHPLKQLQLVSNFRSAPALVNWVNEAFARVFDGRYTPAAPQRQDHGAVRVHPFVGERQAVRAQEAQRVAELVAAARQDHPEGSIAILVRSRSHLQAIVPALQQAGIRFAGQDIDKLSARPAVIDFLAVLKAWWHRADRASWMGLLRAPFVGLSWDDCWVLANAAGDDLLSQVLLKVDTPEIAGRLAGEGALSADGRARVMQLSRTWNEILAHPRAVDIRWAVPALWHSLGGPGCIEPQDRHNIDRLMALLADHAEGGVLQDWREFSRALDKLFAESEPAPIEIMTIHKSKGLEFDTVILPGLGEAGRSGESALFHWRRLSDQLVIAPRSPRGSDEEVEGLYRYLRQQQQADAERELDRLLYVALTRAKRQLHVLGAASLSSKGELRISNGSLMARLWPLVESQFEATDPIETEAAEVVLKLPLVPRLARPAEVAIHRQWQGPAESDTPIDRLARQERLAVLEANIEERCIGLVFHELMRRLAVSATEPAALYPAIAARLRHHCHPESALKASVERVKTLVDNTLSCEHGRWILQHYGVSGAEQALRRQLGEQSQKLIVDRFFVDGDTCWIIDYKTAQGSGEAFLAAQRERYQEKMATYKATIAQATGIARVRAGLYFPASQALVEC